MDSAKIDCWDVNREQRFRYFACNSAAPGEQLTQHKCIPSMALAPRTGRWNAQPGRARGYFPSSPLVHADGLQSGWLADHRVASGFQPLLDQYFAPAIVLSCQRWRAVSKACARTCGQCSVRSMATAKKPSYRMFPSHKCAHHVRHAMVERPFALVVRAQCRYAQTAP